MGQGKSKGESRTEGKDFMIHRNFICSIYTIGTSAEAQLRDCTINTAPPHPAAKKCLLAFSDSLYPQSLQRVYLTFQVHTSFSKNPG